MNSTSRCCVLVFALPLALSTVAAMAQDHWPQFRGPGGRGIADSLDMPEAWTASENVAWRRDLPGRGWSSPIVWGDRVFVTAVVNEGETEAARKGIFLGGERVTPLESTHHWNIYCLDLTTGESLWERTVHRGVPEKSHHQKNSYASETPVTDGQHLYVHFGNLGVFCLDFAGQVVWSNRLPSRSMRNEWGTGASPALHEERLYIIHDNEEQSYLLALDKHSGEEIWRVERDEKSNWSTPYVWENELRTEIVTPASGTSRAYDLNGRLLYQFEGASGVTIATPYSHQGLLYVSSGYPLGLRRPIFAIRPGASGDITLADDQTSNEHIAWCQHTAASYVPSSIVYRGQLYVLLDKGLVSSYDAKTGEAIYERKRLPRGRAFSASPWAADGNVYFLSEYGLTYVLQAGHEFKLIRGNSLADDDMCLATPAIVRGGLLIRSSKRIYCIREDTDESL